MEQFLKVVTDVNSAINSFAWGPIMLLLLVGTGIFLTVRTGCIQVRKFGYIMKNTVGSLFKKKDKDHGSNLSPFQAVTTALAGTVGTGNIAGVTGAIFMGGPGAVFWMWVSAFFGMCTKYAEIALAMKFRNTDKNGVHKGGPMYYIENGLGKNWKWLAVIFAILGGLASFGIGNIAQSSEISGAIVGLAGVTDSQQVKTVSLIVGIVLAVLVAVVVLGGVQRIGQVTSYLVPFMAIFYILAGIILIIMSIPKLPSAFGAIFSNAFSLRSVGSGIFGYTIMLAMKNGFARGVFSNEAGLGSAPIAHAASSTEEPAEQAMWGVFEVFIDTIIICTITALAVILSGVLGTEGRTGRLRFQGRGGSRGVQHHPARHHRRHHHPDQPAVLRPVHHPELELLRRALLGLPVPRQQGGQPDLQGHLYPGVHCWRHRLRYPHVGHLRHPERPDGHPQPGSPCCSCPAWSPRSPGSTSARIS